MAAAVDKLLTVEIARDGNGRAALFAAGADSEGLGRVARGAIWFGAEEEALGIMTL